MSQLRKMKRMKAKLLKKKKMTMGEFAQITQEAGTYQQRVSICPDHGPYFPPDDLCACYEDEDLARTLRAELDGIKGWEYMDLGFDAVCPIHGEYTVEKPCACYDENGNRKKNWDKEIL